MEKRDESAVVKKYNIMTEKWYIYSAIARFASDLVNARSVTRVYRDK